MPVSIRLTIGLMLFLALGAIAGGYEILRDTSGGFLKMTPRDLDGSPFTNFLIPGLILLIVVGFGSASAAIALWIKPGRLSWFAAIGISLALLVWIAVQLVILGYRSWMQPFYALLGAVMFYLLTTPQTRSYVWTR